MNYLYWLLGFSILVAVFERLWPAREQKPLRTWFWSDVIHLFFNGHMLGLFLYGIATYHVVPHLDGLLAQYGLTEHLYYQAVHVWGWGMLLQSIVALVVLDFVQWCVHNTLHRFTFLWNIHQVHHSVKDGEMDWIVSFRFSWLEPVIYKSVMYAPMMWFGFAPEALFFHAVFGTLIGHLNHANLTWDYGWGRYILNTPRMHLYHHAYDAPATGQNFGIIFSCWDWMFGTAYLPDHPPEKIGFPGVEDVPQDFFGQLIWPLPMFSKGLQQQGLMMSGMGLLTLGGLYGMSLPPRVDTPMFAEQQASSQPTKVDNSIQIQRDLSVLGLDNAIKRFGTEASQMGWKHPEYAVSAKELAEALGHKNLVILDVRKVKKSYEEGHIPSAQLVERSDYSGGDIPGVSFPKETLEEMLRVRGVHKDSIIVIMGDGGPEPYRLWWTLQEMGQLNTRVLDGGLDAWKYIGERLAEGTGRKVERGDVVLQEPTGRALLWKDVDAIVAKDSVLQFVDTRSLDEYTGKEQNKKAKRAGHIPNAVFFAWTDALEIREGAPRLKSPEVTVEALKALGIDAHKNTVLYCQSGTRSAAVYYALLQSGAFGNHVWNYDGSWAEYSRSDLSIETSL